MPKKIFTRCIKKVDLRLLTRFKLPLNKELKINEFSLIKKFPIVPVSKMGEYPVVSSFMHVANINLDPGITRKTSIKFTSLIPNRLFRDKLEWIYLFTVNEHIIKIGGTRNGLYNRSNGYLSGHYNTSSSTNAKLYNTFNYYLSIGHFVKMYAYNIPSTNIRANIFGKDTYIIPQTFHSYESVALQMYSDQTGKYPVLSSNCDPEYRVKQKID